MIELPTVGPTRTSAVNESKIEYVELNANPIQGCSHKCKYCYARKIDLRFKKVESEDAWHDPKFFTNFFARLESELNSGKIDPNREIFLSTMTDLYQPYAVRHNIGRKLIEMLQDYGAKYRVLTKSPSIVRDLDLFADYPRGKIGMSITTNKDNDDVRKEWEPNTVSIGKRLEALNTLSEELIHYEDNKQPYGYVWVSAEPFLPGTDFEKYYREIIYGTDIGVGEIIIGKMNYVAGIDDKFDWPTAVKISEKYRRKHPSIRFHYKKEYWNYLDKHKWTPVHLDLADDSQFCYNVIDEQSDLDEWFGSDNSEKLFVTYCSRTKSGLDEGKPEDLYTSQRVKSFFKYSPGPSAILSYKHGIVFEDEVIEDYDQDTYDQKAIDLLEEKTKDHELIFWSPRTLVEGPWIEMLDGAGVEYSVIRSIKERK